MRRRLILLAVAAVVTLAWLASQPSGSSRAPAVSTASDVPDHVPPADELEIVEFLDDGPVSFVDGDAYGGFDWRWRGAKEPLPPVTLKPLTGRVHGPEGDGLAEIRVSLSANDAPPRWDEYDDALAGGVLTGEDGSYRFDRVPEGTYDVVADIETWERNLVFRRTGIAAGSAGVDILIRDRPGRVPTIRVKVLLPDGSPLGRGRMVLLVGPFGGEGTIEDGYGEMRLKARPPPGQTRARLGVKPEEPLPGVVATVAIIDLNEEVHEITLDEAQFVSGVVLLDGVPASVEIETDERWSGSCRTVSDTDGKFRLDGLPRDDVDIRVPEGSPYRLMERVLVPSNASGVVVRVARAVPVTGRILPPPGVRLGEAHLKLRGPWQATDFCCSHGEYDVGERFEVGALTPGETYELQVWGTTADGGRFVPRTIPFVAGRGPLEIPVERGGEVKGRVVRQDGSPVPQAIVSTFLDTSARWSQHGPAADFNARTTADAEGRFLITGVGEDCLYVAVTAPDMVRVGPPPRARPGEELRIVMAPTATVAGRVIDPDGKSLCGLTVEAWCADPDAPRFGWLPGSGIDGDGRFSLEVAPGPHVLYVWSNDWLNHGPPDDRHALAEVEAGQGDVRLVLKPGMTVKGRAVLADGSPAWGCVRIEGRWGMRRAWTEDDGTFEFRGVPPGACTVAARTSDLLAGALESTATAEAGGAAVELVLR